MSKKSYTNEEIQDRAAEIAKVFLHYLYEQDVPLNIAALGLGMTVGILTAYAVDTDAIGEDKAEPMMKSIYDVTMKPTYDSVLGDLKDLKHHE